jgi:phytoene/squalene synthetase
MVDKDLVEDFYRAYAYFRWIDDVIDISTRTDDERIRFISRQKELIDSLYQNKRVENLTIEEGILKDLINNDRGTNSGLQSFIRNMFAIIEFDAKRKGRLVSSAELDWYVNTLGKSVTDGLLYFINHESNHLDSNKRNKAGVAAHITHLLRDMHQDIEDGFINIPQEYLAEHNLDPLDMDSPSYNSWIKGRVELAREYFTEGKEFLDQLNVLRRKIVGHWYCARFEVVLDTIEHDGYILRTNYHVRQRISTWLKIAWIGISLTFSHIIHQNRDEPSSLIEKSRNSISSSKR